MKNSQVFGKEDCIYSDRGNRREETAHRVMVGNEEGRRNGTEDRNLSGIVEGVRELQPEAFIVIYIDFDLLWIIIFDIDLNV